MKKKLIIISIILTFFLLACLFIYQNQNNDEYSLIELTGQELLETFVYDETASITFALYNEKDVQSEEFLESLEKTAHQAHQNIYYVNTSHVTFEFEEIINTLTGRQASVLSYYVIQDGKILLSNSYTNFNTMYGELNGKKYDTKINKMTKKEKMEFITNAQKAYKEGNIAEAHNYLSNAWDIEEAKTEWLNNRNYKIIGNWEQFIVNKDGKTTKYTNAFFPTFQSKMYIVHTEREIEGFEPPSLDEYTEYDILIKDNYIQVKNKKTGKYENKYEIISIGNYSLELKEGNTTYTFQYGY